MKTENIAQLSLQELVELDTKVRRELKSSHKWFNTERPDWDAYFSFIAYAVSLRGSCVRRKVGAVLVSEDHDILATGYNGKGAGLVNCADDPCKGATASSGSVLHDCEAIHAEVNALTRCHDRLLIHTVYVTCSPCVHCVDILLGTSAKRIVFSEEYSHNEESKRRWERAGREWCHYKGVDFPSTEPETVSQGCGGNCACAGVL